MQFALTQLIVTALLACSAMVQATPTSLSKDFADISPIVNNEVGDEAILFPAAGLEARQYVLWSVSNVWVDANKSGARADLQVESLSHCYNLVPSWNDVISSLEVLGGVTCTYYVHAECQGSSIVVRGPGSIDYLTRGIMNDNISSLNCVFSKPI